MIYNLSDFFCLDIAIHLFSLTFCLFDFINICKLNFDITSSSDLAIYPHQISSPDSPDNKSPSFLSHA